MFATVVDELTAGRKRTHWIWYIFPQLRGLGLSEMATFYGISSMAEAHAYLDYPVLGPRLDQCTQIVLAVENRSLHEIFGSPDDKKFHSSMTLFALASDNKPNVFQTAIDRLCQGQRDERTVALLNKA